MFGGTAIESVCQFIIPARSTYVRYLVHKLLDGDCNFFAPKFAHLKRESEEGCIHHHHDAPASECIFIDETETTRSGELEICTRQNEEGKEEILSALESKLAEEFQYDSIFISALKNENIDALRNKIKEMVEKLYIERYPHRSKQW